MTNADRLCLTSDRITSILRSVWPYAPSAWLTSRKYQLPTSEQIRATVLESGVRDLERRDGSGECDFFALQMHAAIRRQSYLLYNDDAPWPVGQCLGTRMDFSPAPVHACNIVIRDDHRVLLIEPQTYQMIEVAGPIRPKDRNHVFFILM